MVGTFVLPKRGGGCMVQFVSSAAADFSAEAQSGALNYFDSEQKA